MSPPISIRDSFANTEWDSLAYTLTTLDPGIDGDDAASRRLRARLGMVRMLMYEEIKGWNGNGSIDLSFLIASFKAVKTMEMELQAQGIRSSEFLIFFRLLLYKFEKQRIRVKKPLALLAEFRKMKRVVENVRAPL